MENKRENWIVEIGKLDILSVQIDVVVVVFGGWGGVIAQIASKS